MWTQKAHNNDSTRLLGSQDQSNHLRRGQDPTSDVKKMMLLPMGK